MGGYGALVWFRDRDFILRCLAKPLPFPLLAGESGEGCGIVLRHATVNSYDVSYLRGVRLAVLHWT